MTLGFFSRLLVLIAFITMLASCKEEEAPPLDCTTLKLALASKTDVSACGLKDGQISVSASGGLEPYTFTINSAPAISGTFNGLNAGKYIITVTDATTFCSQTIEVGVGTVGSDFEATSSGVASTVCAPNSNGLISIDATGGSQPYSYRLGTGAFVTENVFPDLGAGSYTVQAKDAQDCIIEIKVDVPGMRYETIRSLIELNCATKNCHNGDLGAQSNYLIIENVKENARGIRTRTGNKTMPPSGNLTQEQIDLIACWVDEGANI